MKQQTYWLKIKLESDAAFTRGDGVAGEVDSEVQHDHYGIPYMSGKTLKGLLSASCAEVISALQQSGAKDLGRWKESAGRLLGRPGSKATQSGLLHVGDARFPLDLREAIMQDTVSPDEILESLTTLRRQTAMNNETGAPKDESLRTIRAILRENIFASRLDFAPPLNGKPIDDEEEQRDLTLLAACAKALRRAGAHRNRGLGKITVTLHDTDPFLSQSDQTNSHFSLLKEAKPL